MKLVLAAAGVAIAATSGALADPINKYTITGRSAAAAQAQGVPLDQTPRPPEQQATDEAAAPASAADGAPAAAAPQRPRIKRYGLLGLSWRSE